MLLVLLLQMGSSSWVFDRPLDESRLIERVLWSFSFWCSRTTPTEISWKSTCICIRYIRVIVVFGFIWNKCRLRRVDDRNSDQRLFVKKSYITKSIVCLLWDINTKLRCRIAHHTLTLVTSATVQISTSSSITISELKRRRRRHSQYVFCDDDIALCTNKKTKPFHSKHFNPNQFIIKPLKDWRIKIVWLNIIMNINVRSVHLNKYIYI